jgi:virulence-associated protein VagC
MSKQPAIGKLFWTGGSQAVRLPRAMRLDGTAVVIRREGNTLTLEPLAEGDTWNGFWAELKPLKSKLRRARQGKAGVRDPL